MKELKKLFAALVCYRHNMQVLHWKVTGHGFDCVHGLFDVYTAKVSGMIDDIGEILLALGENPLSLQECIDMLDNDDDHFLSLSASEDYDADKAFNAVGVMFDTLMKLYDELSDDDDISSDIIGKLDEHKFWIRIENGYKNKKRMMK